MKSCSVCKKHIADIYYEEIYHDDKSFILCESCIEKLNYKKCIKCHSYSANVDHNRFCKACKYKCFKMCKLCSKTERVLSSGICTWCTKKIINTVTNEYEPSEYQICVLCEKIYYNEYIHMHDASWSTMCNICDLRLVERNLLI